MYIHVVVPVTPTQVWELEAKAEPFHQSLVVVSSIESKVLEIAAPIPAAAVPVKVPVQFVPYVVLFTG